MSDLLVFNTTIITATPGTYRTTPLTAREARAIVRDVLDGIHGGGDVVSAIGHESTAQIATELLGVPVPVNRIPAVQQVGQAAIVVKLRGRPPEGQILDREQVEEIGYDLVLMERVA